MSSSVADLIARLDAAKLEAEREAREQAQREREEQQRIQAMEAEAAAEAQRELEERRAAEAAAERERWRVDEEESAREVAELKRQMRLRLEKPKPKEMVQVRSIPTVVIDIGSGSIKAGFAGEDAPRSVSTSVVGTLRDPDSMDLEKHAHVTKDIYTGDEVWAFADVLNIMRVVSRGAVQSFPLFKYLLQHIFFDELGISPDALREHPVMITEPPLSAKRNREELAKLLFNEFHIPALFAANTSSLAIFGSGRVTGVVIDIGYNVSTSVALYDGEVVPRSLRRLDIGGADLDEYLATLLRKDGVSVSTDRLFDSFLIRDIKEQLCFVAQDLAEEQAKDPAEHTATYDVTGHGNADLPGYEARAVGDSVAVSAARFLCPEALFDPGALLGRDILIEGVHNMVLESIKSLPIDLKREMWANVILSGGTALLPGMAERMQRELRKVAPPAVDVTVHAPVNRHLGVWSGGSVLASTHHFNGHWISRQEYETYGPDLIHATR